MDEEILYLFVTKMKNVSEGDIESDHRKADGILCDLLIELGYGDVVKEYYKIKKWYA